MRNPDTHVPLVGPVRDVYDVLDATLEASSALCGHTHPKNCREDTCTHDESVAVPVLGMEEAANLIAAARAARVEAIAWRWERLSSEADCGFAAGLIECARELRGLL